MASNVLVSDLITEVRDRGDYNNSARTTDAFILRAINSAWRQLYDELVMKYDNYFVSSTTFATTNATDTYALPADFYKLISLEVENSASSHTLLYRVPEQQKSGNNTDLYSTICAQYPMYDLEGNNIVFYPFPSTSTIRIKYVPTATTLTAASTLDTVNGWEEFLVLSAIIEIDQRGFKPSRGLEAAQERERRHIMAAADARNINQPMVIANPHIWNTGRWWR